MFGFQNPFKIIIPKLPNIYLEAEEALVLVPGNVIFILLLTH